MFPDEGVKFHFGVQGCARAFGVGGSGAGGWGFNQSSHAGHTRFVIAVLEVSWGC